MATPAQSSNGAAAAPATPALPLGDNIQGRIEDNTLILTIDLTQEFGRSGSGKSTIVATSRGNVAIPGTGAKLGLNIYR